MLWVTGSLDVRGKAEIASFEKRGVRQKMMSLRWKEQKATFCDYCCSNLNRKLPKDLSPGAEEALRVADTLPGFGFDLKLLGSQKHVSDRLQSLSPEHLEALKESFVKNDHPRFRREFAANRHMPYGTAKAYGEGVRNASMERMARLVKITGMLLQTKVYLFWRKS